MHRKTDKRQKKDLRRQKGDLEPDTHFVECQYIISREIAELESVKVEDDRHTASLNNMVESLESTLNSYK